jgi:cytochrome c peroxidase
MHHEGEGGTKRASGRTIVLAVLFSAAAVACGGGGGGGTTAAAPVPAPAPAPTPAPAPPPPPAASPTDVALRALIQSNNLTGDPRASQTFPAITDPLPQLGKLLFFSKALSANKDTACASCHHPALGGGDGLSLPIGAASAQQDVLGPGRRRADGTIVVGRNANTFFNAALYDQVLFWDGRVESLGKEKGAGGSASGIRTPASAFGVADPLAGPNLLAAQARSPIAGADEMRGDAFPTWTFEQVRDHIAARLGNYGNGVGGLPASQWLPRFRTAFNQPTGTAEQLITFPNIMRAIAEYQRSAVFVDTPWRRYVQGDLNAISQDAKLGALLFYRGVNQGGAACVQCHKGDFFTDEKFHAIGFPQIGPGMGDAGRDDLGRQRASGTAGDVRAFRTPSLLNVELTGPWGHAGAYSTLQTTVEHYLLPRDTINAFLAQRQWCTLPQFVAQPGCAADTTDVERNTRAGLARMEAIRVADPQNGMPVVDLSQGSPADTGRLIAFMQTLTDPCLKDRACFGRWIPRPDEAPDGLQLNATDANGRPL